MWGGDPLSSSEEAYKIIGNEAVLEVNQNSENNRMLYNQYHADVRNPIWMADIPKTDDHYIAFFNRAEIADTSTFHFTIEHLLGKYKFTDLWENKDLGVFENKFKVILAPHTCKLYKMELID